MQTIDFRQGDVLDIPMAESRISAGFPSPAADYMEKGLDLNEFLVDNPSSTFFVRVEGCSMTGAGINPDDILIVDRSIEPRNGSIVIAALDGEMTVKRLSIRQGGIYLMPENSEFDTIKVEDGQDFNVWGVVTACVHPLKGK